MPIDLARFYPVFIAESLEHLDAMEAELLRPDVELADSESVNTIFRAAHTIKGGGATFDFQDIVGLTHVLETLLDQVRKGDRTLEPTLVDLLLESADCLRELLLGYQRNAPVASTSLEDVTRRVELMIGSGPVLASDAVQESRLQRWTIRFTPHSDLLRTGNDPYRILRELGGLGNLEVKADISYLPKFSEMDPESSYLSWVATLNTDARLGAIEELFEWVEGHCALDIHATELNFGNEAKLDAGNINVEDGKFHQNDESPSSTPAGYAQVDAGVSPGRRQLDSRGYGKDRSADRYGGRIGDYRVNADAIGRCG